MATTSATTASATSALITSLGGGTGVDMSALANNLAAAQFAAKADRLAQQSETLDRQISAASNLKSMMLNFSSSLGTRVRAGDLSPQPVVANANVAKASLSGAARPKGSFSLEVTRLATTQTLASPAFAAATTPVGAGSLTLRFGTVAGSSFTEDTAHAAVTVSIASGATLADVASAINGAGAGVTAFVANTTAGAKLVLKGAEGAANGFTLEATETPGEEGLAALAWTPAGDATRLLSSAGDAAFKLDGLAMSAASNRVTDAIPGLNLELTATNSGVPTQISFADTSTAITGAMQDLVSALNEMAAQLKTDTDPLTGDLARDSGARLLRRSLAQLGSTVVMPNAVTGEPKTLAEIGLSTQRDGSYQLDSARLTAALKASPDGVAAMFTNGLYGVFATIDGIARRAGSTSDPGALGGSISRYTKLKTQVSTQQDDISTKQEALRTQLVSRFAKMNSNVGSSKSTLSFLQNQIDAWNNSKN